MPWNPTLGMNVFDPLQAYASGQPAAEGVIQGQRLQMQRREDLRDERKLQILEQKVRDKAAATLRRNVGLARMQDRAKEIFGHMDQTPENWNLAQRNAFLENASDLYAGTDRIGDIANLLKSDEAQQVKLELGRKLDERQRAMEGLRQDLKQSEIDLRRTKEDREAADKAAQRDQKALEMKLEESRETGRNLRAKQDRMLKAAKDPEIQGITASLNSAREALAAKRASPKWHWLTDEEGVKKNIADLEAKLNERYKALGLEPEGTTSKAEPEKETPKTTGKRVKVKGPNGQTGTVPEGTELPAGWELVK